MPQMPPATEIIAKIINQPFIVLELPPIFINEPDLIVSKPGSGVDIVFTLS